VNRLYRSNCGVRRESGIEGMGARVTLKEIAQHAGVSPATVSLVLRDSPLVAKPTRKRIQASIDTLGYVYDRSAANLRTRSTQTIGLIVCEITNPFYAELTAGIDGALDRAGWVAFLANTAESPARQDRFIERMREQRVDGLLLSPAEGTDVDTIERLHRYGLPVVQMLRRVGKREADFVGPDFRLGMTLATEHLIRLGHKRIAYVGGGRRTSPVRDRGVGYRETMVRHGLPVGPIVGCLPTREAGAAAVGTLLRGKASDPTAVLCYNDVCAFGFLLGLADKGLKAGSDCAVVGFDDIEEAAYCRPALTTVAIGPRQLGEESAGLLLRRIKAPNGAAENVILPPRLIIRSSCGARSADLQSTNPAAFAINNLRDASRRRRRDDA
jgi:LacI family transcriptional regulator